MKLRKIKNVVLRYRSRFFDHFFPQRHVNRVVRDSERWMASLPTVFPGEATIEIGNKCNLNCMSCETHLSKRPKDEMEPELFASVLDGFLDMGIDTVKLHTNNEPIFNKNIIDLLRITNKKNIHVNLSTNGMLVKKFIDNYVDAGLDLDKLSFRYSIDGGIKETFERVRHGASYEKLIEGLDHVMEVYETHGSECRLSVNYNLSSETVKEVGIFLKNFKKYFGDNYLFKNYFFRLLDPRGPGDTVNRLWQKGEHLTYPTFNVPCWIPFTAYAVLFDGRVTACCSDFNGDLIVGDIRESHLKNIWNGPEMNAIRQAHLNEDISNYPTCHGCYRPKHRLMVAVDMYIKSVLLPKYINHPDVFVKKINQFIMSF